MNYCLSWLRCSSMLLLVAAWPAASTAQEARAHAHNDYQHDRPLFDAIERGFASVEVDVFLVDGELLVGHDRSELKPGRTLETLYLAPLRKLAAENRGEVLPDRPTLFLLIDVKSEAEPTYAAIDRLLATQGDLFSTFRDGKFERNEVTAIISGNRAAETIRNQPVRYAGIDGRPADLDNTEPWYAMPWISANWNEQFTWKGDGPMPEAERTKLRDYVKKAHSKRRRVRFWATPESEAVWKELVAARVDFIGTDDLARLQQFLDIP